MAHHYQKRWVFTWNRNDLGGLPNRQKLVDLLNEIAVEEVFQTEAGLKTGRGSRPLWARKPFQVPGGFITLIVLNKRSALQLLKLLLTKKQYSVVKELVIIYSYFRYVKFVVKVGNRCVKLTPKAYRILKTKVNNKIPSIRRRRRERYFGIFQKPIFSEK